MSTSQEKFQKLLEIIDALREPESGCPWDLKQDLESLTRFMSEESSEYISAVASGNTDEMADELGDVLLQVVLNAKIASQENKFNIDDVIDKISDKMIRRHPHVFSDKKLNTSEEVLTNWEQIKQTEKKQSPMDKLLNIPASLTALMEADQIGRKSKKLNFDWPGHLPVFDKVIEEVNEVKEEIDQIPDDLNISEELHKKIEHEIGDLLFSSVQLARHLNINPELALKKCNQRFYDRFSKLHDKLTVSGRDIQNQSVDELEKLWDEVKKEIKSETAKLS